MRTPLLAAALAILGCSSDPGPAPVSPPANPPPTAAAPTASARPKAEAETASVAPSQGIKLLGSVGDIAVASYPPTGFDKLKPQERVLAYHLSQAALAGDPIFLMQTSRYALPATQLVRRLLSGKDKLPPALRDKLVEYRRMLFLNNGLHDPSTGQKFSPPIAKQEIEEAARLLQVELPGDLLAGMFDPKVAPTVINKTPGKGKDPITESAANHYEGVTTKDLQGWKDTFELNGRVTKQGGKIVEQVYRAGGNGAPKGLAEEELGRVVGHLSQAILVATPAEQEALRLLLNYFKTGDNQEFKKHDIAWLKQVFPVDYILGFIETHTDVRERKGAFEGLIGIADPERDPPLQALAKSALYFEQRMPWKSEWKRDAFQTPAAAAITVLAAAGYAGPMTFFGVNLPNTQEIRQKYGSKNFVLVSVGDSREAVSGAKTIDEFAPEEARAELHRCARYLEYASISFHEITGHGSGKVNPNLPADPSQLLAPYYSTLEEGRAELVASYLSADPKTVEIGLLPDAGCARIYPQSRAVFSLLQLATVPEGEVAEESHLRADLIAFGYLKDKGAIVIEERAGKTFFVVKDPDAWHKAIGELLAEHHRIKATGDKAAIKALVEKYGSRINPKWRDQVIARLKSLGLPRAIATIPPVLSPVLDGSGRVVDAKAEQTISLDAYLDTLERASRP